MQRAARLQGLLSQLSLDAGDALHDLFTPGRQLLHSGPARLVKSYGGHAGDDDAPAPALLREGIQQCLLFTARPPVEAARDGEAPPGRWVGARAILAPLVLGSAPATSGPSRRLRWQRRGRSAPPRTPAQGAFWGT